MDSTSLCLPNVSIRLPSSASGKRRRHKRHSFDIWVRKVPWRRAWQPTPVFLPGESHGLRESDMTEVNEHARTLEGKIDAILTTCENEKKIWVENTLVCPGLTVDRWLD